MSTPSESPSSWRPTTSNWPGSGRFPGSGPAPDTTPLVEDQTLAAGELLGTHIGPETSSDVAVRVDTPTGQKLVSWFDTMSDSVFAGYQARGVAARTDLIIARAARAADPLTCVDGGFTSLGTLPQWVVLTTP